MDRICTNCRCILYQKPTQSPRCSNCSLPTRLWYIGERQPLSGSDLTALQRDQPLPEQPMIWQPFPSNPGSVSVPQTFRRGFLSPVVTWGSPPQGSPLLVTPPLSSKSITPFHQFNDTIGFDLASVPYTQSPEQNIFRHYHDPKAEAKAKEKLGRTCMSCYNKTNRKCQRNEWSCAFCTSKNIYCRQPIRTIGLFDHKSFDQDMKALSYAHPFPTPSILDSKQAMCLLTLTWSAPTIEYQANTPKYISSCYIDVQSVIKDRKSSIIPQLDELLDGDACPKQRPYNSKCTNERIHRENLETSCRRLCVLIHILSYPDKNIVKCTIDDQANMSRLLCMVFCQICQKITTLWEEVFEYLRSWVFGPRDKPVYSKHKAAVAASLAQLLRSLENYAKAFAIWSSKGHLMPRLNCSIETFALYLGFIGKGVDMNTFDTERLKAAATTPAMHLSTISFDHQTPTRNDFTFFDVLTSAGLYGVLLEGNKLVSTHADGTHAPPLGDTEFSNELASSLNTIDDCVTTFAPESLTAFMNSSPDSIQEEEYRQQTKAKLTHLIAQRTENKQESRDLKETIDMIQAVLGISCARQENIFEEILPTFQAVGETTTPAAMTLAGAEQNAIYEPVSPEQRPQSTLLTRLQSSRHRDTSDMDNSTTDKPVVTPPNRNIIKNTTEAGRRKGPQFTSRPRKPAC